MSITFGTDGWRAVISDEFTFANVRHVAQAIAEILLENATTSNSQSADAPLAVIGFDTRFLRTWEFYLAYCEAAFAEGNTDVMQFTLRRA